MFPEAKALAWFVVAVVGILIYFIVCKMEKEKALNKEMILNWVYPVLGAVAIFAIFALGYFATMSWPNASPWVWLNVAVLTLMIAAFAWITQHTGLRKLYPRIAQLIDILKEEPFAPYDPESEDAGFEDGGRDRSDLARDFYHVAVELSYSLEKLNVHYPPIEPASYQCRRRWFKFLVELAPLSKNNDLERARDLLRDEIWR